MGGNNGRAARDTVLQARCVELRLQGLTYRAIGEAAGCSHAHAWRLITRAMETINDQTAETVEILRRIEAERLDAMLSQVWPLATREDPSLPAIDRVLKIMERRARLYGLDAPAKVAPTTPEGDAAYNPYESMSDAELLALARAVVDNAGDAGTAQGEG